MIADCQESTQTARGKVAERVRSQAKILIIDDEESMLEHHQRLVALAGYTGIASTTDPFAAFELFRKFQPDLVIVDLLMPGISGMGVIAGLRAEIPADTYLPILVVTGSPISESRSRALGSGATDLLRKPFDATEFMLRVDNLLETRFLHLQLAAKKREVEVHAHQLAQTNIALRVEVAARERSEIRLRAVTESVGDAIVSAGADGKINFWNHAAESIFGHTQDEVLGKPLTLVIPERYREPQSAGFAQLGSGGETRTTDRVVEVTALRKDGTEFPAELTLSRWNAGGADFFTAVLRDITERKLAREALQEAKDAAERANSAKSEFLSRMSHELRTPLNAILGFAQLLEMDARRPAEAESASQVLKAGHHLLGLVNEVLDIARIESGRISVTNEPVLLHEVLEEATTLLRPLAARQGVTVHNRISGTPRVSADRQRLKQVVLNLLSNAIKYNRESGAITVRVVEASRETLRLEVHDTGFGISPTQASKLFNPFERLDAGKTQIEGIGLGLAISRRLVELMGGTIGVESTSNQGSTFWVELRLADDAGKSLNSRGFSARAAALTDTENSTAVCADDDLPRLRAI